jgi:hypothetical protein
MFQRPDHPTYGKVDWNQVSEGNYAIVNPFDVSDILYMTPKDFQIQVRVSMTQNHRLLVLAEPFSKKVEVRADDKEKKEVDPPSSPKSPLIERNRVRKYISFTRTSEFRSILGRVDSAVLPTTGNLGRLLSEWYFHLLFWATGYISGLDSKDPRFEYFLQRCLKVLRTQGAKGLVLRLKALLYLINSSAGKAGNRTSWKTGVGVKVTQKGVPLDLHPSVRRSIARGDSGTIRTWASIANSYKVFHFQGILDSSSITEPLLSPLSDALLEDMKSFSRDFWSRILTSYEMKRPREFRGKAFLAPDIFLTSSGPNGRPAGLWAEPEAEAWRMRERDLGIPCPILEISRLVGDSKTAQEFKSSEDMFLKEFNGEPIKTVKDGVFPVRDRSGELNKELTLGKLTALEEPAGKVRIVAIPDYWTQRVCRPIHDWFNQLLTRIPSDCTFDQEGGLESYVQLGNESNFCYDLKSATDRIPVALYLLCFRGNPVMGPNLTKWWIRLLTERPWKESSTIGELRALSSGKAFDPRKWEPQYLRYAVGQPMGALSSWPSMALVHHFVVQYCAKTQGRLADEELFTNYRILGDDIVLGDKEVSEKYLEVMTSLGVKISSHKSYVGSKLINFANKTYVDGVNISPASLKEEMSITSLFGRINFAGRLLRLGWLKSGPLKIPSLLRLVAHPRLWKEEWLPAIGAGKVRGDILTAMLSFLYPNLNMFKTLGIVRFSLAPLCRVLSWTKWPYGQGQQLQEGSYPKGMEPVFQAGVLLAWVRMIKAEVASLRKKYATMLDGEEIPLDLKPLTEGEAMGQTLSHARKVHKTPLKSRYYTFSSSVSPICSTEMNIKVDRLARPLPGARTWYSYFESLPGWAVQRVTSYWFTRSWAFEDEVKESLRLLTDLETSLLYPDRRVELHTGPLVLPEKSNEEDVDTPAREVHRTVWGYISTPSKSLLKGEKRAKVPMIRFMYKMLGLYMGAQIPEGQRMLLDSKGNPRREPNFELIEKIISVSLEGIKPMPDLSKPNPWSVLEQERKNPIWGPLRRTRTFQELLTLFGFNPIRPRPIHFESNFIVERGDGKLSLAPSYESIMEDHKKIIKKDQKLLLLLDPGHWGYVALD